MSKHSLLPPHATVSTLFGFDSLRLRKGYLTSDVVGLAIRYWRSYPSYLVVCNSLSEDQKNLARSRLDSAYDAATWVLMREAYKIGLDPYALQECGRLVKRLYREDPKRAYYSQKDCYYWPDCIDERQDEWPSELPESEQAVLRNGEAVFTRLVLHWEIAKAAPTEEPLALKRDERTQPDPAGMTAPALLEQGAPETPQSPGASKAPNERDDTHRDIALALQVVVGRRYAKGLSRIIDIAHSKATAENRLRQLEKTGLLRPDVSANALAELLGVTDTAVKFTEWWKSRMANRRSEEAENIENNRSRMLERGRRYERHGADDS